jgi:AmmeMemoRadiSam system protein B
MGHVRPPAVAGMFYPGSAGVLQRDVDALLADAVPAPAGRQPKALIVPHAGYIYSGSTAAHAYALLAPWRETITRVVLLGPTHRVPVSGLALTEADGLATPLGTIAVDAAAVAEIADLPQVVASDRVHAQEHSLEVHLPFLQRALSSFRVVPLAVGHASPEAVAEVLDRLWGGPETLIVISSDLSHFLPYAAATAVDADTCDRILQFDTHIRPDEACGAYPVNGLLLAARRRGLAVRLLHRCNSGDTAGDKRRVVGYAAFAFEAPDA